MMDESIAPKIIVALDVAEEKEALNIVAELKDSVAAFKIGMELINSVGYGIVEKVKDLGGNIFLDLKFMDIPNTVAGASRGITKLGVMMFNLHILGGIKMMQASIDAVNDEVAKLGIARPLILGVTILTSIDKTIMNREMKIPGEIEKQVVHLAKIAEKVGLDGIVASPQEIEIIKKKLSDSLIIVTPGIRPAWAPSQDQKRIMTPGEAIRKGSTYLVIGRPITKPPSSVGSRQNAVNLISEEIANEISGTEIE